MNKDTKEYKQVLDYLKNKARIHYTGEIIVPPVLVVSEALEMPLEQVDTIYQELLERAIIRQFSEYEYTIGHEFSMTAKLRQSLKEYNY